MTFLVLLAINAGSVSLNLFHGLQIVTINFDIKKLFKFYGLVIVLSIFYAFKPIDVNSRSNLWQFQRLKSKKRQLIEQWIY